MMPSEKGSRESTSSSSASPPRVIIWYISFSFPVMIWNLAQQNEVLKKRGGKKRKRRKEIVRKSYTHPSMKSLNFCFLQSL